MLKILGVSEADPFGPTTWSGSSGFFFTELQRRELLYQAISARPSKPVSYWHKLFTFHPEMSKWKFKHLLDVSYRERMTKVALRRIDGLDAAAYDTILQTGAWFDIAGFKGKRTVSYTDGNLAGILQSPYGHPRVSRSRIERMMRYEKRIYDRLDHIFTFSSWLVDSFVRDFNVDRSKLTPVGAGINLPRIKTTQDKRYDQPNILFIGKEFERKGGRYLLDAFARVKKELPNAELTIIGPALSDCPSGVRCLGPMSKSAPGGLETLLAEYSRAAIFVMPSLYEPFGIVFAEAMAHKLPCIGADVCAIPEIIEEGATGYLVPVKDARALAARMLDLLKNPAACKEFGEKGFRKYEKNYTWDIVVQKITERLQA